MFNIPDLYKIEMSFETAEQIMISGCLIRQRSLHRDSSVTIIDRMEFILDEWEIHCSGDACFEDDDAFFEHFRYETNAFNVLYTEMKPLFVKGD